MNPYEAPVGGMAPVRISERLRRPGTWLGILILLLIAYAVFAVMHDEAPDAGIDEWFGHRPAQIPFDENVSVGFLGLAAPEGEDVASYVARAIQREKDEIKARLVPNQAHLGALLPPAKLAVKDDAHVLDCYFFRDEENEKKACASPQVIKLLLDDNRVLLDRFAEIEKRTRFQHAAFVDNDLVLKTIKLAYVAAAAEPSAEKAYAGWRHHYRFIQQMIGGGANLVDDAIFSVAESQGLDILVNLLFKYPQLLDSHGDEIIKMLGVGGLQRWNFHYAFVASSRGTIDPIDMSESSLCLHKQFVRNRIYRATYLTEKAIFQSHPKDISVAVRNVWKVYGDLTAWSWDYLIDPLNTFPTRYLDNSVGKFGSVPLAVLAHDDWRHLIVAAIQIHQYRLKDDEIDAYLKQNVEAYRGAIEGGTVIFDHAARKLKYDEVEKDFQHTDMRLLS